MLKYLFLLLLFPAENLRVQSATDIVGTWKVTAVIVDPTSPVAQNKEFVAQASAVMAKLVFNIKANHQFSMSGNVTNQQMPPGVWQYNPATHIIVVKDTGQPQSKLAEIIVSKNAKSDVFFALVGTPVMLKVKK